ncbi:glyceraldehyde-3-phosphate dehydrogenase [Actibacterium mucosum KCTC 23349]|uniref:Glyceraldehyde-3-phosphate dehydrogenase n=1 Tax=Actibacterium mucosum KCTC 23349 TaxID=1454373 RepID=A0A037ZFW0_9RHOB|nr:hypothetical protein [Actibacterium mucosum]KAJ54493.1 glyceraldehyde-3-phosphate dehydrogenase [Actibacterium mucosum KCTC 23349]
MSNRTAAIFFLVIAGLIGADLVLNEGVYSLFLARKFVELVDWLKFWR